jgi:hypothetical protein
MVRVSVLIGLALSASLLFGGGALVKFRAGLPRNALAVQLNGDAAHDKSPALLAASTGLPDRFERAKAGMRFSASDLHSEFQLPKCYPYCGG